MLCLLATIGSCKLYLLCMKYQEIRERIKKARRANNYTQEEMAELLRISTNSYRELEAGPTTLINPRLEKIAEILKLSMESLLFGHINNNQAQEKIEELKREHRIQIIELISNHKIELAQKEEEVSILNSKLITKEKIIGVLNEKKEQY